jgi:hypothetical protein
MWLMRFVEHDLLPGAFSSAPMWPKVAAAIASVTSAGAFMIYLLGLIADGLGTSRSKSLREALDRAAHALERNTDARGGGQR